MFAPLKSKLVFVNRKKKEAIFNQVSQYAGKICLFEIEKYRTNVVLSGIKLKQIVDNLEDEKNELVQFDKKWDKQCTSKIGNEQSQQEKIIKIIDDLLI